MAGHVALRLEVLDPLRRIRRDDLGVYFFAGQFCCRAAEYPAYAEAEPVERERERDEGPQPDRKRVSFQSFALQI
jgi:hypothetical protein